MAKVTDPTLWYLWELPNVGGDIGGWGGILNTMWAEDTAVSPTPVLGVDAVVGLVEADIDTLRTAVTTLLARVTTLEANAVVSMGARIEKSGTQAITIATSTKVTFGTVVFDEGSSTATVDRITVPASGAGAWQIRASVTGERFANGNDSRYWELIIKKTSGSTVTNLARSRVPYLNDGGDSTNTDRSTVAITVLDAAAVQGDYYEVWIEHGDDNNDSGSSTIAVGTGTFLEGVRVFHEDARGFVRSTALTVDNTAATNHAITLPAINRETDDILLIAYAHRGTGAITTPTGYTALANNDDGTSSGTIFWRRLTGGEAGGDTLTITKVGTSSIAAVAFLLRGMDTTNAPEAASADVSGGSADPPSLTPSWGATKTVFLAISSPGVEETVTDAPTNYSVTSPAGVKGSGNEQGMDPAFRLGKILTEDPGAFSYLTAVGSGILWTIAIEVA